MGDARGNTPSPTAVADRQMAEALDLLDDVASWTGALDQARLHTVLARALAVLGAQGAGLRPVDPPHLLVTAAVTVESGTVESGTVESGTVESGTVESGTVESGTVEFGTESGRVITAPVRVDGEPVAVLTMTFSPAADLTEDSGWAAATAWTVALSCALGATLASAAHRSEVTALRSTDPLTGLGNRGDLISRVDRLFGFVEPGRPLVVAFLDVNGMLAFNEEHGHEAGDLLLIGVSELLREVCGELPGSHAARLAGDEFGLVTGEHPVDEVVAGLARVLARASADLHVSLGCGVAEHRAGDGLGAPSALLQLADAAEHRAKRTRAAAPVVADARERAALDSPSRPAAPGEGALAPVTELRPRRRFRDQRPDDPAD